MYELRALLARCSDATLLARCLGRGSPGAARLHMEALPSRSGQFTVAAWAEQGMVGVGSLLYASGGIEFAVLVEDAWQRHGVGTALARRLSDVAALDGALAVTASVTTANTAAMALLRKVFPQAVFTASSDGLVTAMCPVIATGVQR